MNTAIYSPSGASAGIGFAIPVDTLKFIVETIIRDGKVNPLTHPPTQPPTSFSTHPPTHSPRSSVP